MSKSAKVPKSPAGKEESSAARKPWQWASNKVSCFNLRLEGQTVSPKALPTPTTRQYAARIRTVQKRSIPAQIASGKAAFFRVFMLLPQALYHTKFVALFMFLLHL
jgi:hypothetical protein